MIANKKPNSWNEIQILEQIGTIIRAYNQLRYGSDASKYIWYGPAYPEFVFAETGNASLPEGRTRLICYDIIRKEDGSMGVNRFDSDKRVRPVEMEKYTVTINEGREDEALQVETVYMKPYDLTYRFDCLAPTDAESLDLVRDFERMMEIHARYLESGCQRFVYDGRKPSYYNRDTRYKSRTCQFFVQIQETWYDLADRISQIELTFSNVSTVQ